MTEIDYDTFLEFKIHKQWTDRGYPTGQEYLDRIKFELDVIKGMKYASYFLIVADLCRFMTESDIFFIVRGSGCGSCVVWGLGISHEWLDPVQYKLPFERFLNPNRVSLPDLDIDIDDTRRDEVVQYTIEKYGRDRVSKIITFGTMAAKNAIKDTFRASGMQDYDKIAAEICAFIPGGKGEDGKNIRLADELKRNEGLREWYKKYPEQFKLAMRLEGKIRNASIHAAGTIIAPDCMTKFLPTVFWGDPVEREKSEWFPTSQWDMYDVEERGLLKMDYLGLKTLRVISQTCKVINKILVAQGKPADFNIDKIDRRDPVTWEMLSKGRTNCVFQVEKSFVQGYAKRMNLAVNRDPWQLAVLISIIRPGMMDAGATEEYLQRAAGAKQAVPLHPLLGKTLAESQHLFVFQEDCMWAARDMAAFNMSEADDLRRAISKKKPKDIARIKPSFIAGAIKNGATKEEAEMVWGQMETFGRYGFNNAHAAAYGLVIMWMTAWLKCNWTLPFMTNMINSEAGVSSKEDGFQWKVSAYVEEARSMGIKVLPPDLKKSYSDCSMVIAANHIRFGLGLVKQLSVGAITWLNAGARKANSFKDLVLAGYEIRPNKDEIPAPYSKISKSDYESLIKCGAVDCYESGNRAKMLAMLPKVMELVKKYWEQKGKESVGRRVKHTSEQAKADLDAYNLEDGAYPEISLEDRLEMEHAVTGCFLSESPFEPFRKVIEQTCNCTVGDVRAGNAMGDNMTFAGLLTKVNPTIVKNGKNRGAEMGHLGFTGLDGASIEAVAFNKSWLIINNKTMGANGLPLRVEQGRHKVFIVSVRRDRDRPDNYVLNDCTRLSGCGFAS